MRVGQEKDGSPMQQWPSAAAGVSVTQAGPSKLGKAWKFGCMYGGLRHHGSTGGRVMGGARAARSDPPSFSISIRFEFKTSRNPHGNTSIT